MASRPLRESFSLFTPSTFLQTHIKTTKVLGKKSIFVVTFEFFKIKNVMKKEIYSKRFIDIS